MGASAGVVDVWMRGGDFRSTTNTPFNKPSRVRCGDHTGLQNNAV